ncbi:permease yjgp/yjgq family protein [hydrocarbon metagenome]|uniref:Permease yjgp/yjgq family protein n=1 Tax=hydrocarbon metagenome TaxID=938273 RepID=A0A0W8FZW4_9ZZZZ
MIIDRYILRNHGTPFLFASFVLMAVLLLQFLMKFADRLVGKGLDIFIIIKLIAFNLAWMVVLVIPMAVLIATLMAFGNLAQNNEVAILKASGVSLYRMMLAPTIAAILIGILLIQFNNYIYPEANHAAKILMQDISRKKPTLSLVPGVFSHEVPNYSILARDIDRESNKLKNLTIYDSSTPTKTNIVTAKEGVIYFSKDQKKLILDLKEGEIHESALANRAEYRILKFEKHKIALPGEDFTFQQTAPGGPRGDRELGAPALLALVDSIGVFRKEYLIDYSQKLDIIFVSDSIALKQFSDSRLIKPAINLAKIEDVIKNAENNVKASVYRIEANLKSINRFWVEIHKKYSLPFACIVFLLIGAPFGTMVRKGGFGMAAGISLFFFLIYWAFLIGGEKLADRGMFSPFWGMWSGNIVFGILGIYLTIKAAKERVTLSFDFFNKLIPKQMRSIKSNNDKEN